MNNLISIIVPVYNVERYIDQCIESIVNQSYKNIEIILVDDGSKDCSLEKCKKWERIDSRIKVIHQENQGEFGARNTGLHHARGEWLGFVDADDYVEYDMYEKLLARALADDSDCAGCEDIYEDEEKIKISQSQCEEVIVEGKENCIFKFLQLKIPGGVCSKLIRKKLIIDNKIVFRNVKHGPDLLFMGEYFTHCRRISLIAHPYYHYIKHSESICNEVKESKKFDKGMLSTIKSAAWLFPYIKEMSQDVKNEFRAYYSMKIMTVLTYSLEKEDVSKLVQKRLVKNLRKNVIFLVRDKVYSKKFRIMALGMCMNYSIIKWLYNGWKRYFERGKGR